MSDHQSQVRTYIQDHRTTFEDLLGQMVEVPSVSSDIAHAPDMHRMAQLAVQYLEEFGAKASIVKTSGFPSVSGEWVAGRQYPSLTIYNHLDVQPAKEPEWRQSPFAFHKEGERYCGRGTTDDKGPALTALLAARFAREAGIPLNIRVLWELEEEIGSPHFSEVLQNYRTVKPSPPPIRCWYPIRFGLRKTVRLSPVAFAGYWPPDWCCELGKPTFIPDSRGEGHAIPWPNCVTPPIRV